MNDEPFVMDPELVEATATFETPDEFFELGTALERLGDEIMIGGKRFCIGPIPKLSPRVQVAYDKLTSVGFGHLEKMN